MKMSIGMELARGPGDFVLDGDPAPTSLKGDRSPSLEDTAHHLSLSVLLLYAIRQLSSSSH